VFGEICRPCQLARCFTGRSSLSSWFTLWGSYCLIVYKDCRLFVFVELCQGVGILSDSECSLLGMSSCVVLTVLEKVSIIEFVYLVRSCVDLRRDAVLVCLSA